MCSSIYVSQYKNTQLYKARDIWLFQKKGEGGGREVPALEVEKSVFQTQFKITITFTDG